MSIMNELERAADGAHLIKVERIRQRLREGWTEEHDDSHRDGELAMAGACYALNATGMLSRKLWPWNPEDFKPTNRIRDLVKAGALIAAEIDRLKRAEEKLK